MASLFPYITTFFLLFPNLSISHRHHRITVPDSSDFIPQSLAWDKSHRRFILAGAGSDSDSHPSVYTISDAGDLETLLPTLPEFPKNSAVVSVAVNTQSGRLLVAISPNPRRASAALGAYDLAGGSLVFLTPLPGAVGSVTTDFSGNAFVTDSSANLVYKINLEGSRSVLSSSQILHMPESERQPSWNGLSGVVFVNHGFLLACQKDSGKIFRIDAEDGVTRQVLISGGDIVGATVTRIRRDGYLLVVGERGAWLVKGRDNWAEASVIDELKFSQNSTPIDVAVREGEKVYVLFKSLNGVKKDEFFLEEIEFPKETEGEHVWAFVLLGLALAYVIYWRFQMRSLVSILNKKTN